MKFSIAAKLTILVGVVLFFFLLMGGLAYNGLQAINTQIVQVVEIEEPTSAAAYEMDLYLLRIIVGALGYLQDRDVAHVEMIQVSEEEFNRSHTTYINLAETERGQTLGEEARQLFHEFMDVGETLITRHDQQYELHQDLLNEIEIWEALLENEIQPSIHAETDQTIAYQKLRQVARMEANLDESQRFVGDYLHTHDSEFLTRIQTNRSNFEEALQQYRKLPLSAQEQKWATQLETRYTTTAGYSDEIIELERANIEDVAKFVELRHTLGNDVLYEGIIKSIAQKDMVRSREAAMDAVMSANQQLLIVLLAGGTFAVIFSVIFARNMTRPLKQVVQVASQMAVGDLSATVTVRSNDEIGIMARSFGKMIAYLQNVAALAESIANGDLQVEVSPKSDQDMLNISLKKMVRYIQDVSEVTEKIADKDLHVTVQPKSDSDALNHSLQKMISTLHTMIEEIEQRNWLQNGLNQLNNELLGESSLVELCQKTIQFVARYLHAGHGAIYIYDAESQTARMYGSFAFTRRDRVSNVYQLGEGVIGQVALEQQPILLKNIPRDQRRIETGTSSRAPLSAYTLPLLYNQEVYGVLEIAAFELFNENQQQFLTEAGRVIATSIFSARQRERVEELLRVSQRATKDAEQAAREAEQAKQEAQQKADEVQRANTQLEEQQQQLRQQSEELQQINANLEEQQQRLHQQSEELRQQNESLTLAREELDKRAKELELASKYKSEFLANMSHELRTPLNSIILLSKMLSRNEKQNLNERDVKQVSVIHQAGEELLRLINDILDLSKIEAGKVTLNPIRFSSETLLDSFRDLFHSLAEEKGLEFIIDDQVNAMLFSDKDKLSQVIRNLLSNAFKFTRQGSVTLSMSPVSDESLQIAVTDTGVGIPKDKQMLVFEAFQQADGSTSREFGGTGLGLSIAREYMKLLQGSIKLESEEGEGSSFILTLPYSLKDVEMPEEEVEAEAAPKPARPAVPVRPVPTAVEKIEDDRTQITPQDKVILIIEDNADLAQTTMEVTREMGFKVLVALTGREGLELAAQHRPLGILLDLVLPDINGMEVLRELKSTRELRHIPVHIVSSKERDNAFRAAGAIGYYQKPVNDLDIQHAVENLMAVSQKYPKQLLIVEDDDVQREALRDLLNDSKAITITGVSSQEEAIHQIEHGVYDAAIIDLGLKDGSGYEICRYIKEHNITLPIIIYTGRELTEQEERELRKYTDSIIIKTARSYERLTDEVSMFLHKMYQEHDVPDTRRTPSRSLEPTGNLEGKRILIVDDDMKNVFVLASALENNGALVVDAQNGQAALEVLRQRSDIDLVLMDIMMPVMDGYTTIREIRKDPALRHLPIIALTAKALKGDRQKCIQAGADDYLSKPVDYDGLIRLAKAWIEKG